MFKKIFLFLTISSFFCASLFALDPYSAIDSLLSPDLLPRVIHSEDISELSPHTPVALLTPTGDFNDDGDLDIAISGIYVLAEEPDRYFLLVASLKKNPARYEKLYLKEYPHPVFLHKPGTTGIDDSGLQAFSKSTCIGCNKGEDFFWERDTHQFITRTWPADKKRITTEIPTAPPVLPDVAELALQVVGELEDVKKYTHQLKQSKGILGVDIQAPSNNPKSTTVMVRLFERKDQSEILYDLITVDTLTKEVVKRKRAEEKKKRKK